MRAIAPALQWFNLLMTANSKILGPILQGFLKDIAESLKRNNCLQSWSNSQNYNGFPQSDNLKPLWVKIVFWLCSALQRIISFLAWENSLDPTAKK